MKLGKQLSTKKAKTNSDDEDDDDSETEEVLKKAVEPTRKKLTEVPLILAPSQLEAESNPWLTTTEGPPLPSSEYSKPTEVRNDDQSSSSDSEDDDQLQGGETDHIEDQPPQESTKAKSHYGVTSETQEHLQMPSTSKSTGKEQQPEEATRQHQMNIQEAFADDDVLAEFEKEKVRRPFLRAKIFIDEYN